MGYGQLMVPMTRNSRDGSHRSARTSDARRSKPHSFGKINNISQNGGAVPAFGDNPSHVPPAHDL